LLTYFCKKYSQNNVSSEQLCAFVDSEKRLFEFYDCMILIFIVLCIFGLVINYIKSLSATKNDKRLGGLAKIYAAAMPLLIMVFGAIAIYSVFAYLGSFYMHFIGQNISDQPDVWGQAGDFFGGMLNPFLAFCSFMALLYTIHIQTTEMRLTREEQQRSATAAQKSADLSEKNLEQQAKNIERQFEIARYKELMGLVVDKVKIINRPIYDSYIKLTFEPNSGEDGRMLEEHVASIKSWFDFQTSWIRFVEKREGRNELYLSCVIQHFTKDGKSHLSDKLEFITRELVLLGRLLRDIERISSADATNIRSEVQLALGILLCTGYVLYKDPSLSGLNIDVGPCHFDGFLNAYKILLDPPISESNEL